LSTARCLPPILAAATLLLLGANALPSVQRKHLLQEERRRLERELSEEERVARRLTVEVEALRHDPFYLERVFVETWQGVPQGAVPFVPPPGRPAFVRAD